MNNTEIYRLTSFLPENENYSLSERKFFIDSGVKYIPICVVCNGLVHSNGYSVGWGKATLSDTCSKECRSVFTKTPDKFIIIPDIKVDDFTENELELLKSIPPSKLAQAYMKTNQYNSLYLKIRGATKFLDNYNTIAMSVRIQCIIDNIQEVPKCTECGKEIHYTEISSFKKYCSDECRVKNNNTLTPEIYEKLNSYEWMYSKRVENRMSQKDIGILLGISEYPVKEYLIKHNMNNEKFNESMPFAKAKLRDKDWLFEQHVTSHKKCEEIANEIGTSKATVSVWLNKHGIPTNEVNSYPRTFVKESIPQKEIREYIQELLGITISSVEDRTILNGQGIDIVIPNTNICIEHHGIFRHTYYPEGKTDSQIKGPMYHRNKYTLAKEKGYHLIQIFGDQWQYQKEIVKSIIASKLGKTKKIYARHCKIVDVPRGIKNNFLDDNHIQGYDRSSIRYGLEYEGKLVAVMTFSKTRRGKSENKPIWELCRFCCQKFTTIVGGFSKLLKHFTKNNSGDIISYSDTMWSEGNVYLQNGFKLTHEIEYGFYVINKNGDRREHRENYQKKKIGYSEDPRSGMDILIDLGHRIIFDAGIKVWVLKNT